jgi:hypothetical protein
MKTLKKILLTKIICLGLFIAMSGCSLDEKWYSEAVPDTFFTSRQSVLSVFGRPFTHFRWYLGDDRWGLQELTADVFVKPTRGPHWSDGGSFQRLHYHTWTPDDGRVWDTWRGGTMGMALAIQTQEILAEVDYERLGFTQADKDAHFMQLQVLIAYFYMRSLDYFGGMPIFTATTQSNVPRSTDKETFEHIENLILEALPKLPKKTVLGRSEEGVIHQAAAAMLLAQLYFNAEAYIGENRFSEAAKISQDIIANVYGTYGLDPTWYGIHSFENDKSPEMIWTIPSQNQRLQYNWFYQNFFHYNSNVYFDNEGAAGGSTAGWNGDCLQPSLDPQGNSYGFKLGRPFEKFHDLDLRKKPFVYLGGGRYEGMFLVGEQTNPFTRRSTMGTEEYREQIINMVDQIAHFSRVGEGQQYATIADLPSRVNMGEENSGIRLVKVPQPNRADQHLRNNPDNPLFRLTEVYFMLAECKWRTGDIQGAADLINQVRRRNFENGIDPNPVTAANLDSYRLLDEWLIEFIGEGRRRTDLIRWNKFITENWWDKTAEPQATHLRRFPIPNRAISGSGGLLIQNPGYN